MEINKKLIETGLTHKGFLKSKIRKVIEHQSPVRQEPARTLKQPSDGSTSGARFSQPCYLLRCYKTVTQTQRSTEPSRYTMTVSSEVQKRQM